MRILNRYITRNLVVYCLIAVAILTFVMLSANLFQAFDLMARGISPVLVVQFIGYLIPYLLSYTIPFAMLCTTVLVFGRLSADNELTAMRASGVSIWQIISPALLLAVAGSVLCGYLQLDLAPECRFRAEDMVRQQGVQNPLAFLEAGRHVEFPGYVIYIRKRDGEVLEDVQIYELDAKGHLETDISARRGTVEVDTTAGQIHMRLEDVMVTRVEAGDEKPVPLPMREFSFPLAYARELNKERVGRDIKHMDVPTIVSRIYIYGQRGIPVTPLYVELHKRLSLAFSPMAMLLIGIPFGVRTRRSEASIGMMISVALAMFFYAFILLAESLEDEPQLQPALWVWVPNIVYQLGGLVAIWRIERR